MIRARTSLCVRWCEVAMRGGLQSFDKACAIPLTVVGGPAGAGKSAVIRHLMEAQVGRRVVVLARQHASAAGSEPRATPSDDTPPEWSGGCMWLPSRDPVDDL